MQLSGRKYEEQSVGCFWSGLPNIGDSAPLGFGSRNEYTSTNVIKTRNCHFLALLCTTGIVSSAAVKVC